MRKSPRQLIGINVNEIARICHVSLKTAARWKAGTTCPPWAALVLVAGDLVAFDKEWSGWTLRDGFLISPEGWRVGSGEVLAIRILRQQLAVYEVELKRLQTEAISSVQEQPLPDAWPEWVFEKTA